MRNVKVEQLLRMRESRNDAQMSRFMFMSDEEYLMALRRRIVAGDYAVNASKVAGSIVSKLKQVRRARRALADGEGDRTPTEVEPSRPGREAQRPPRGSSSR